MLLGFLYGVIDVILSYDVYFLSFFLWVKGGKFFGVYGYSIYCFGG